MQSSSDGLGSDAISRLLAAERSRFQDAHPRAVQFAQSARAHWLQGVPLHWMQDWGTPVPIVVESAAGATLTDIDGHTYADFCLGDTGAMFGHSPPAVVAAVRDRAARGFTYMLPTADALAAGERLAACFGLPCWQITQTASDANRSVLRWARAITNRPKVLVFDQCYHGQVDDAMVRLQDGHAVNRPGLVGQVADLGLQSTVVEFNDLAALEAALGAGDVACVLAEPVMTNCGMVLPAPGFLLQLRARTRAHGTLLVMDETHTLSSAYGGYTRQAALDPDFMVVGKAIAGGFPCAVYGFAARVRERMETVLATKPGGHSGMGTTLSGNALALAALAATLQEVMTPAAYEHMELLARRLESGFRHWIAQVALPWHVARVGARLEVGFRASPPRTGRESLAAYRSDLGDLIRLYCLNRGVLLTPFHMMMLVCPATTSAQIDRLLSLWSQCIADLRRAA